MKPLISICAIFILFQSLMFWNLVKLELPSVYQDKWGETRVNSQEPIDIFLRPERGSKFQNLPNRNFWFPYPCSNAFTNKNILASPVLAVIPFNSTNRHYYSIIPVFINNCALRL